MNDDNQENTAEKPQEPQHHVYGVFDQGVAPLIACVNKATADLGVDYSQMVGALQGFTDEFAKIWGTPAKIIACDEPPDGAWSLLFLDDADEANALGYHDLTVNGLPCSKVFVKTTRQAGEHIAVTASHEIAEMLIDPGIQLWAQHPDGRLYAYETADAVEESIFNIDNVPMSNFVYPAYFEGFRQPGSRKFDYLGKIQQPYELLSGGYSIIMSQGKIKNIFGSSEKRGRFLAEDRRMHRSDYRKEQFKALKAQILGPDGKPTSSKAGKGGKSKSKSGQGQRKASRRR